MILTKPAFLLLLTCSESQLWTLYHLIILYYFYVLCIVVNKGRESQTICNTSSQLKSNCGCFTWANLLTITFPAVTVNLLADSCWLAHPAFMKQHHHAFRFVFLKTVNNRWTCCVLFIYYSLSLGCFWSVRFSSYLLTVLVWCLADGPHWYF